MEKIISLLVDDDVEGIRLDRYLAQDDIMLEIVDKFNLEGSPLIVKNYANGLVNKTYLVETTKHKYILH